MSSRPAPSKTLLLAGGTVLAVAATALVFLQDRSSPSEPAATSSATAPAPAAALVASAKPEPRDHYVRGLRALLDERDPARRRALLRAWSDSIPSDLMASLLEELRTIEDAALRNEARQALLYSWTTRDLVAVTQWFGTLGPSHDLQQEGRDQLVLALLQCDPEDVLAALQTSLPPTTSQQLYGPYFRGWAAVAPDLAAGKLVALAAAESGNPSLWHDLMSQVAAQWVETDLPSAIAWVRALPTGPAKTQAELQASYRWAELDPVAASAYAAEAKNLQLVKNVAGKWAESSPADALRWAHSLPDGVVQARALSGAATAWAQADPQSAARYAAVIESPVQRADVATAVASAWAFTDPQAAGEWVRSLPADEFRDRAVSAMCDALRFTAPEQAFTWAFAFADPTLRDHAVARVAVSWLKQEPAAARDAIARASLTDELKASIFAQATPPKSRS